MRVLYYGPFRDGSGYSVAARGYLKGLQHLIAEGEDIDLRLLTLDLEGLNSRLSNEDKELIERYEFKFCKHTGKTSVKELKEWCDAGDFVLITHCPAPMLVWEKYRQGDRFWECVRHAFKGCSKHISFTVWEADEIHEGWRDTYDIYDVDAVAVPSDYNYEAFSRGLRNQKVYKIPHPLNVRKEKKSRALRLGNVNLDERFVVFSSSQWGIRKGFDKLVLAYCMEFGHQQDVLLVIKTGGNIMNSADLDGEKKLILGDVADHKKMVYLDSFMENPTCDMVVITDHLPYENIQWLYEQADVFCLPSRAEGFGLTIAEAIYNKVPVITTRETGQKEFVSENTPLNIEGTFEPYIAKQEFHANMNLFEPSLTSVRKKLRLAYEMWRHDKKALEKVSEEQYRHLRDCDFTVERVARDLKAMLEEVTSC